MARIAFFPFPQVGHVNGTFKLARLLRARGHDIHYLAQPDIEEYVRAQGWSFTPVFGDLFPVGLRAATDEKLGSLGPGMKGQNLWLDIERRMNTYLAEVLFGSGFEARLRETRADLVIVDSTDPLPAIPALRLGIPAAALSTTLPLRADTAIAPLWSPEPPPDGWWSRFKVRAGWNPLWARIVHKARSGQARSTVLRIKELSRREPELGKLCHFRSHLQFGPYVDIPTLITCCAEFDFRRDSMENLHYIGPGVDLDRAEPPLPPEVEQDSRPLIYCSLGSQGHRALQYRPFFQAVLDVVARKPEWRLLMVVGKSLNVADFQIPPNASVVESAPQLAALRRASVMITHGGLNSVKECICLGVPMIVFPMAFDQPGNGARIVHHGLGLMGNLRQPTPETISSMLETVMGDSRYRARVRAMQELFLAADASTGSAEVVERLIANGPASATARPPQAVSA